MKRLWCMVLVVLALTCSQWADETEKFQPIFNGRDLSGWRVPTDNRWWTVEDQVLRGRSDVDRTGSVLWTAGAYRDFVMSFEFRFGSGTVDSGIFLRDEREQIQIGISGSLRRDMTASPYISGKGYPVEAQGTAELLKPHEWNSMIIAARGPHYTVWLNGQQVLRYGSETAVREGPIGIQLHPDREMSIDFRKLRMKVLSRAGKDHD